MASYLERFLWVFHVIDRNQTTFQYKEDVPHFTQQIVPIFITLMILENIACYIKTGTILRLNDGVTSFSLGVMEEIATVVFSGIEFIGYEWLYERRFIDLDWQAASTWYAAVILVDFGYYWFHRSLHEISLFWCNHQVHHSSEYYNLYTAVRQSAFQNLFRIGIYHPLALIGIPLPAVLVHLQFNLFFQFWIHTEYITNLGPLEWIFNTASHHRVHHGVNKWCLDKNYAGFLIIWDKLFGTFEPERKDEKIVYSLFSQPKTFNPVYLQIFYYKQLFAKSFSMKTWRDSFKALFYGPGWNPGTPRLGDMDAIPEKPPARKIYDPEIPTWAQFYLLFHFLSVLYVQHIISAKYTTFNWFTAISYIFFVFFSLFTIGSAFDSKWWMPLLEVLRCLTTVAILLRISLTDSLLTDKAIITYFAVSAAIWTVRSISIFSSDKRKIE